MNSNCDAAMDARIAVVIPCYRVREHILGVISQIPPDIWRIYVVDDCCPEQVGVYVKSNCQDLRVRILFNEENLGVGGAVINGYRAALSEGAKIIVKIDGDGQMDPVQLHRFVRPILEGRADYTKGNRFYDLGGIREMPRSRVFGNAVLSFMAKISTGYWNIFDPTNGYTAIHAVVATYLPFEKISNRFFFESDMLFRLNILRAVILDVPMNARYGCEKSNLFISRVIFDFAKKHVRNFCKRIFYNYYLRDMTIGSIEFPIGIVLMLFGAIFGALHWYWAWASSVPTPLGTIMLAALPLLTGLQMLLAFLAYDISTVPTMPIHTILLFPGPSCSVCSGSAEASTIQEH